MDAKITWRLNTRNRYEIEGITKDITDLQLKINISLKIGVG